MGSVYIFNRLNVTFCFGTDTQEGRLDWGSALRKCEQLFGVKEKCCCHLQIRFLYGYTSSIIYILLYFHDYDTFKNMLIKNLLTIIKNKKITFFPILLTNVQPLLFDVIKK